MAQIRMLQAWNGYGEGSLQDFGASENARLANLRLATYDIDGPEGSDSARHDQLSGDLYILGAPSPGVRSEESWSSTCYLFVWPSSAGGARLGERQIFVPTKDFGWYFGVFFSSRSKANRVENITDTCLAKAALHTAHTACTKVGTWTTTSNSGTFKGDYGWSVTAGSTLSASITGGIVGVLTTMTTNGGYGIVSIDGDYTRATRLPLFSAADYAAGRCRQSDVGKRYFSCYASALYDEHVIFADDLAASAHAVTIEATGTKAAASSDARCYIQHLLSCNGETVGASNIYAIPVHYISHNRTDWSAHSPVVKWAPSGSSDYQFLGENHADGTQSKELTTALSVFVDVTDQTALAAGSYASGTIITINHTNTVAHKANLSTVVATKVRKFTAVANRRLPIMCDSKWTWSASGTAEVEYPVMLRLGEERNADLAMENLKLRSANIGGVALTLPSNFDNAISYIPTPGRAMIAHGSAIQAFAEVVSETPDRAQMFTGYGAAHQDRTTFDSKMYIVSSTGPHALYASGDVQRWVAGWGASLVE